jgi:hypothetical protein
MFSLISRPANPYSYRKGRFAQMEMIKWLKPFFLNYLKVFLLLLVSYWEDP